MEMETQQSSLFPSVPQSADWRAQVPSVSQLTRRIRGHLESGFTEVWVKGEVSNFRKPVSGHAYLILKDSAAQMRTVLFRPVMGKLRFALADGMEVLVRGRLSVYEARGEYQLVGEHVEPVGQGALQLAFEQLKARLHQEGLFDPAKKKPLPVLPRRVGIVTSQTGAAAKDILKVLHRRFPNLHVVLFPASVQGDKAAAEICAAIRQAEAWNVARASEKIEVLIVGRGGGSIEDLWCFNEEAVARALYACSIPTISAVGHEIDVTIADFVADLRAPTPSAAAEIVVPRKIDLQNTVALLEGRLAHALSRKLDQLRLHLTHLSNRLVDPREKIRRIQRDVGALRNRLGLAMYHRVQKDRKRWERLSQLLHALSPLAVLGRGFSLTQKENGDLARQADELKSGEVLTTRLAKGTVKSIVNSVSP